MMSFIPIPMNAARICDGLSKIGYTPSSAICDIIDNSVSAQANHVYVKIEREKDAPDTRLNNVKEYLIIDDGKGMNSEGMLSALALGSSSDDYEPHSLSKFGLGLKSASFSQGERLEVISSTGEHTFLKYIVSLPNIRRIGDYGAEEAELTQEDSQLVEKYLTKGCGTIVRIAEIRKNNHPSIKSTLQNLRNKVGAIYYYMMKEDNMHININDQECAPFDVLFTEEANANGNLDEYTWDGLTTRWIEKPISVTVDAERNVKVKLEVTQLPHPPTFEIKDISSRKEIRDKYSIDANNYGYYVYRNRRLLAWCESLGNIIPQQLDYYAFRGRILIDDTADEAFNIDVKKSYMHLSEEAYRALDDVSAEYKRKSRKAWQHRNDEIKRLSGEDGLARANTLAQEVEMPEELPGNIETEAEYAESERREHEIQERQRKRLKELVAQVEVESKSEDQSDGTISDERLEPTEEEIKIVVAGEQAGPSDRIFPVTNTMDNVLWEPYYDTDKGVCVRLNRLHRFIRVIYENNANNGALHTLMGLLFLQLAGAERYIQRNFLDYDRSQVEAIIEEYRRVSTDYLAKLCRDLGDSLPSE